MSSKSLSFAALLMTGWLTAAFIGCNNGSGPKQPSGPIEILAPKGGETYKSGQAVTIKWQINDPTKIASVGIRLSIDNGKSYSMLVDHSVPAETTTVSWTVTSDQVSNQCIVEVYDYSEESIVDKSGAFSVTQ